MLPRFVIIGGQKSGTTALFDFLCRHPGVSPPERFEIHYFDVNHWRGLRWYLSHFPLDAAEGESTLITGEKTPDYFDHPAVPARVAGALPDCKFILLCRNPVDRAYSHFQHSREQGFEPLASFEEALQAEPGRLAAEAKRLLDPRARLFSALHHAYVGRSIYADHLERWFAHFPRERFFVASSEELFQTPGEVLSRLGGFLELGDMDAGAFRARNVGRYSAMDEATRARLEAQFAPHNERFFTLLGRRWEW